jgi:EmrB/QacA subfamily drug resistance transporter
MSPALPAACDRAIAESVPSRATVTPRAGMVLATCILASSLAFIDGSVVNVALPAIGRDLGAGGRGLSAIVNSYLLPLSALLLIGGAAGDRYGRRRTLVLGVLLFALASLWCVLAPGLGWLVLARALQGVGAALLMPNSLAILGASFQGDARSRAIGIWAAAGAAAGAIGPLVGGWLVDAVGWRTIFLINLPIAGLVLLLAARCLRDEPAQAHPPLDLGGAGLATAGLAALTWGLTAAAPWTLGCGVALLCGFVLLERRRADRAMLPASLFGARGFVSLNLLTLFLYGALGALFVMLPFVLIEAAGYSAIRAGAALLPLPLVIAAGSPLMGRLGGHIAPRLPLALGPLAVVLGFVLMLRIDAGAGYWSATLPAVFVVALGMALAVAPLTTTVLSSVDARHTGLASGFNSAVARLGGLVGTALLGSLLSGGPALVRHFHVAALACAVAALVAGGFGFVGTGPAVLKKK